MTYKVIQLEKSKKSEIAVEEHIHQKVASSQAALQIQKLNPVVSTKFENQAMRASEQQSPSLPRSPLTSNNNKILE